MLTTSQHFRRCTLNRIRVRYTNKKPAATKSPSPSRSLWPSQRQQRRSETKEPAQDELLSSPILSGITATSLRERIKSRGSYYLSLTDQKSPKSQLSLDDSTLIRILDSVELELKDSPLLEGLGLDSKSYKRPFFGYKQAVLDAFKTGHNDRSQKQRENGNHTFESAYSSETLHRIDEHGGEKAVASALKYGFYGHLASSKFSKSDLSHQKELADLRYPNEWFPATRTLHRTVHLHVGPTNSGKTYHALKRLEEVDSGVYAGPLRLLAHEVYSRLNAKGKRCLLITGEERRSPDDTMAGEISSCTVEMVPLNKSMEVAVIDEIQMIGSRERGWAWTQAFLGLKAKELHVCGEERSVPLIRELAASVGDKLEVHKYQRLSPLQVADKSLRGDLRRLRKGDCIVSFSVMGIHSLRKEIEKVTGRKVAIVYGSLPPETRAQQARLFNDPDNDYDFLVASDAIGMGLNLSIKRIIFETTSKRRSGGRALAPLSVAEVKQIAGRAGRFRTAQQDIERKHSDDQDDVATLTTQVTDIKQSQEGPMIDVKSPPADSSLPQQPTNVGYVTTLEKFDFPFLQECMESSPEPIKTAGLFPPGPIVENFARYFPPGTPFSYILLRLHETSKLHTRFHLCELRDQLSVADAIQPVKGLTTMDRLIFCAAPASTRDESEMKLIRVLAKCVEQQRGGDLLDIHEIPLDVLDEPPSPGRSYLLKLERLHKGIILYLWLGYRFSGVFNTQRLALHVKELVEAAIEKTLAEFSFSMQMRQKIREKREKLLIKQLTSQPSTKGSQTDDAQEQDSTSTASLSHDDGQQAEPSQFLAVHDGESHSDPSEPTENSDSDMDPERGVSSQSYTDPEITQLLETEEGQRELLVLSDDQDQHAIKGETPFMVEKQKSDDETAQRDTAKNSEHQLLEVGESDDGLEDLRTAASSMPDQASKDLSNDTLLPNDLRDRMSEEINLLDQDTQNKSTARHQTRDG